MSPVCLQQGPLARVHQHGQRHRLFSMRSMRERLEGARRHAGRNQPVAGGCPTAAPVMPPSLRAHASRSRPTASPCLSCDRRLTFHPLERPRQRGRRAVRSLRPPQCGSAVKYRRRTGRSAPPPYAIRLTATVSFSRLLCTTLVTSAVAADGRSMAGCRDAAGGATEDAGAVRCWWSCCCRPWSSAR
jgi:hypothetical protein